MPPATWWDSFGSTWFIRRYDISRFWGFPVRACSFPSYIQRLILPDSLLSTHYKTTSSYGGKSSIHYSNNFSSSSFFPESFCPHSSPFFRCWIRTLDFLVSSFNSFCLDCIINRLACLYINFFYDCSICFSGWSLTNSYHYCSYGTVSWASSFIP